MKYKKHVFICTNQRAAGERKSCGEAHGMELVKCFKKLLKDKEIDKEDKGELEKLQNLVLSVDDRTKIQKELLDALDARARVQYLQLTDEQCLELLLGRKWYRSLLNGIFVLYTSVGHAITTRNIELGKRYEYPLPEIENEELGYASRVKKQLESMGFSW